MEKAPMTANGFVQLKEELRWRQQEERPRIIEAISEARAHGDLSENAEYHAAKEAQSHNEGRIGELEDLISRAEVIDPSKLTGANIKFGATVTLADEDTDEEKVYQIVGDQEKDVHALLLRGGLFRRAGPGDNGLRHRAGGQRQHCRLHP